MKKTQQKRGKTREPATEQAAEHEENASDFPPPVVYPRNDHCVSRADIDSDALKILYRLVRHGFKAYLVGGGVRDLLLGKRPKDFDIATDATPRKIKSLFRNCRIIGRRFKLAHIYFRNHKIIEVATFRELSSTDDSNPEGDVPVGSEQNNIYGTPASDAHRRDLTINALFYELSTFSIIDYVGGLEDLKAKTIRIIGCPKVRYQEDPVRMMRVVRHAARADFEIEKETFKAIQEHHELIEASSQVRVYEELKRDFGSGATLQTLRLLGETGLLEHLLPELLLNDSELLEKESYFSEVISRIDEDMREGNLEPSATVVLSIIALFLISYPTSYDVLAGQPLDREELSDHIRSCFVKLTVPRKERERIEDLLGLWLRLLHTPLERVARMNLERRKSIRELSILLRWLGDDSHGGTLLEIVEKASKAKADGGERGKSRRPSKKKSSKRQQRKGRRGSSRHSKKKNEE
jgi:poly(A) polymerase